MARSHLDPTVSCTTGIPSRQNRAAKSAHIGPLLLVATTFVVNQIAMAQALDPLCGPDLATAQALPSNVYASAETNTQYALALSLLTQNNAPSSTSPHASSNARIHIMGNPATQQTVDLEPLDRIEVRGSYINVRPTPIEVKSCSQAIQSLQSSVADIKNRKYTCALLEMDRKCLTNSESQPHVKDFTIPFRSIAVIVVRNQAVCTGLLLNERSFKTARHCFIDQTSGHLHPQFSKLSPNEWSIETLDAKRKITINPDQLEKMVIPGGFDIDQDPITITVTVTASAGAKPLPKVALKSPSDNPQLLWLAGPVYQLDQAIALHQAALNSFVAPPKPHWRESIRWSSLLGAQCRTIDTEDSCVFHSCQTFQGFSGSPMITNAIQGTNGAPDTIEYVGVHSGTPGIKKPFGWPGCNKSSPTSVASDYFIFNVGKKGD